VADHDGSHSNLAPREPSPLLEKPTDDGGVPLPIAATVDEPCSLCVHQTSPMSNPRPAQATCRYARTLSGSMVINGAVGKAFDLPPFSFYPPGFSTKHEVFRFMCGQRHVHRRVRETGHVFVRFIQIARCEKLVAEFESRLPALGVAAQREPNKKTRNPQSAVAGGWAGIPSNRSECHRFAVAVPHSMAASTPFNGSLVDERILCSTLRPISRHFRAPLFHWTTMIGLIGSRIKPAEERRTPSR